MVIFAGQWWLGRVSGGGAWVVPSCLIRRFRGRFWIAGAEMTLGGERGGPAVAAAVSVTSTSASPHDRNILK